MLTSQLDRTLFQHSSFMSLVKMRMSMASSRILPLNSRPPLSRNYNKKRLFA